MKKEYRIKRNEEFQKIIDRGKSKACRSFVVYYAAAEEDHDRIGISVGKKLGNAVERNKVKRQVREMLQEICDFHHGADLIVIVRVRYHQYDYQTNKKDLSALLFSVYNNLDKPKGE